MSSPQTVFKPVPAGGVTYMSQTIAKPILYGQGDGTYDWVMRRWLPTHSSAVSPDGTRYAYAVGNPSNEDQTVHIVDIASGEDKVAATGRGYWPLAFNSDGLYIIQSWGGMSGGGLLLLLNPSTNELRQLYPFRQESGKRWRLILGHFAYGADLNPADPNPPGSGEAPNSLIRLDLTTGAIRQLVYRPGETVWPVGQTSDGSAIAALPEGIALIDAQGNMAPVNGTTNRMMVIQDSQNTWFLTTMTARPSLYRLSGLEAIHVFDLSLPAGFFAPLGSYLSPGGGCN
jgi:hypothetical protein